MKKLIIAYKNFTLKVHIFKGDTIIFDSYKVKRISDMKYILNSIREEVTDEYAINQRSIFGMISEWRVHNLLYSLGVSKLRTRAVNLNVGQPWYIKTLYAILSIFYLHF